ncbi:hypothetical protein [Bradyrhizobium sp. MOS001]|uniref:hypothetical protein n=1 Tax=unclassified Bradyrhizobium TaxID=2631580 RepID=UPI00187756F7|nr:hypothetical protein [Bradyrhizobium sp. MOS001]
MSILVPKSLICAPPIKFGLSFGRLRFDNKHLLVCELPFSLDDIALYLLIERRSRVHHDTLAAMLAIHASGLRNGFPNQAPAFRANSA